MAADINIREHLIVLPPDGQPASSLESAAASGRVIHEYGPRVKITALPEGTEAAAGATSSPGSLGNLDGLDEIGRYGLEALQLRESQAFAQAKANRAYDGFSWSDGGTDDFCCTDEATSHEEAAALANAPATSARLNGSVAVGIVIVQGPTEALKFTTAERTKVVAEVQNGLGWLGAQNPSGAVVWKYDIQVISITTQPGADTLTSSEKEARWRDPVMQKMGYGTGMSAVSKYVEAIRTSLKTDWTYCAFFTKYPLGHFAYASIGGPRLVMQYANDGWGPDNIDRVFAHETGHIFGAPDEYKSSNCTCGGSWGYHGQPNANCEACNPNSVDCIMKGNTWNMCAYTPYHLGFPLVEQRYSGVWRAGSGKYGLWVNSSWDAFNTKWNEWAQQGLRLQDLKITTEGNIRRYHGVWNAGTGAYGLWVNVDWNNFVAKWQQWAQQGLRLIDLEIVPGAVDMFSGVWTGGNDAYGLWVNADWNNFVAKWNEWGQQGLRLIDLKVVNKNGQLKYSGVWRAGSGGYALWANVTWESFTQKWKEWAQQGLRLIDLEIVVVNGERRYFGVWGPGSDAYGLWVNADWPNFKAKWEEWSGQGLRLMDIDIYHPQNVGSPMPSTGQSRAASFGNDENGPHGVGFSSVGDGASNDLGVGGVVFPAAPNAEAQAFGPNNGTAEQQVGLGGLGNAEAAGSDAAFGGLGQAPGVIYGDEGFGGHVL